MRRRNIMSKINTVLGPIDSSALGYTRMHEHLLWRWPGIELDPLVDFDEEDAVKAVTEMLLALKNRGVSTLVDATPINLSRHAEFLVRVAEASGMNIIAATGFSDRPFLPFYFAQMNVDHLASIMEYEITQGIRGTHAKAGIIKVGTAGGAIAEPEAKILRAAARVSRSTGVPIITHTERGTLGIEQLDIFKSEGADLSRIVIGHTCSNSNIAYYLDIIERGAYAGFDRIGWTEFQRDEVRLVAIAGLIGAGYADKIVLSQDVLGVMAVVPGLPVPKEERKVTYLDDEFIPRLLQGGIAPKSIKQILTNNPKRIFGG
jgi:phosphotriesterase-related protein